MYNKKISKILIRNKDKKYFENNYINDDTRINVEICVEKNSNGEAIAYFVEYDFDISNSVWIDIDKEFSIENNISNISQIIDIIYYYKNFNVGYSKSMYIAGERIYPTNPYGCNDLFYVENGLAYNDSIQRISKLLYKYGLLKISGNGLKYVNLGLIIKMNEINSIPFSEFKLNDKSTFNDVLKNWVNYSKGNLDYFLSFFKSYINQIKYIFDENDICEKLYDNEFLIPNYVLKDIMLILSFDEKFKTLEMEELYIEKNSFNNDIKIKNENEKEFLNYEIIDIDGDDLNISKDKIPALVDHNSKIVYIGNQINVYFYMLKQINDINIHIFDNDILDAVSENDINDLTKLMCCYFDALQDIHNNNKLPIESIVRYRLINHFIFLKHVIGKFDNNDLSDWLYIIKKHQILNFSIVKNNALFKFEDGTLYVPKDRPRSQSTLKYIIDKYLNDYTDRNNICIYDQKISIKRNKYYLGDNIIKKVVFIFDTIQKGNSTNKYLDNYLCDLDRKKCLTFLCDEKEISVLDILNKNKCKIEICSIYASDIGIANIEKNINSKYYKLNISIKQPLEKLDRVADKYDILKIEKFYPMKFDLKIRENDYLIIREYNQPKRNIMPDKLLDLKHVVSLFCKRKELSE